VQRGDGAVERLIGRRSQAFLGVEIEVRGWVVRRPSERGMVIDVSLGGWLAVLQRGGRADGQDEDAAEARGKAGTVIDVAGDAVARDGSVGAALNQQLKTPGH
ncbi:MAG: hypothetical protein ABL898_11470, partial [Hyphomicrobiaceae bacterium]